MVSCSALDVCLNWLSTYCSAYHEGVVSPIKNFRFPNVKGKEKRDEFILNRINL